MPGKTRFCPNCRFMTMEQPHAEGNIVMTCRQGPPTMVAIPSLLQIAPNVRNPNGETQIRSQITPVPIVVNPSQWCHRHEPLAPQTP